MTVPENWQGMIDRCVRLLEQRTGAGVAEWNDRIAAANPATEEELRKWLAEQGVSGYGQMLLVMERFGYPDFLLATTDELIGGQYADREQLRPILDTVLAATSSVGQVSVQARKTYVALETPRRQFGLVKPTTRQRVDLGFRMEGQEPVGRLLVAKGLGNDRINVRIPLHSPKDVDDEVLDWLRRAYAANM